MSDDSKCYRRNKVRKGSMDCGQEGLQGNVLKVKEMRKKAMPSAREKCPNKGESSGKTLRTDRSHVRRVGLLG